MPELSSFNWFGCKNEQLSQFAPRFQRDQTCLASSTSPTLKLSYLLYHAQTSLLDDCAGGTQGVQLLDG